MVINILKKEKISIDRLLHIIRVQTEVVQEGTNLGNIMDLVTMRTQSITDCDGACIELLEGDEFVYSAAAGTAESFLGLRLPVSNSLSGTCIKEATPLISNDIMIDNRVNKETCREIGLQSMIVVPLIFKEEAVGVLKVLSRNKNHFNDEHIFILSLISDLIAAAISSAMRNEKRKLIHKATHDSLTGISNRALFYDHFRIKLNRAKTKKELLGILTLDMNGLKQINDIYGHRAGDAALVELTTRLKELLQKSDTFSRLGGDEFGILTVREKEKMCELIEQINEVLVKPLYYENHCLIISISMGYAYYDKDGITIDELIEKADQSMYKMKRMLKSNQ